MSTPFTHAMQTVTIALLPVSLGLVHVPRSRLAQLSHPILRQILEPTPAFLNITCNEIELSLFAEHHLLAEFEPIARRDRQKQRARSGSGSSRKHMASSFEEPVEISYDKWNVLQIDSHSDRLDNSGARVHELSAPLAAAGISILYQSSYMSDFIFVKETRLPEVMSLLASAGFDLYSSDPNQLTSRIVSPLLTPTSTDDSSSLLELNLDFATESGAVLTRTRSNTDASLSSLSSAMKQLHTEERVEEIEPSSMNSDETIFDTRPMSRTKSHSPTSGEVLVLSPDLACVGLRDDTPDLAYIGLKIIKLVSFPELLPTAHTITRSSTTTTKLGDLTPHHIAMASDPAAVPVLVSAALRNRGRNQASSSDDSSSSSSDEDGYFSHSPRGTLSASSLVSSASHSTPDLTKQAITTSPSFKPTSKRLITPLSPITPSQRPALDYLHTEPPAERRGSKAKVPFFSFTRTPEGSSLTTDVSLLAALFPPGERHMVICSGELDAVDDYDRRTPFLSDDEENNAQASILKCLQIDLRRFGLDKHGLVNRFSRVLEENGINHMYSSTFKTANLLVDKRHAERAQALLRSC